jgi:ADP-ribose pyrophosphatase YjhB (NUDIX family)
MMLDYIGNLRRMIGNSKVIVPGVRALIFDNEGKLLLERQKAFDSWALPHGCVDLGESVYQALCREVEEETGVEVLQADIFGVYTDPKYSVTYPNGDEVQTFTIAFLVRDWQGELRPDNDEVDELGFFDLDDLPQSMYQIHLDTIEDYKNFDGTVVVK